MKPASERNPPYQLYWVSKNPDVLTNPYRGALKKNWAQVACAVSEERKMVILLDGNDEIGGLVPADMFYAMHLRGDEKQMFPVAHVEISDFRKNPENWIETMGERWQYLSLRENLMLLDRGKPVCALVSKYFFPSLEVDKEHKVHFTDRDERRIFRPETIQYTRDSAGISESEQAYFDRMLDRMLEKIKEEHARPMDEWNENVLDLVVDGLKERAVTPEAVRDYVAGLRIEAIDRPSVPEQNR